MYLEEGSKGLNKEGTTTKKISSGRRNHLLIGKGGVLGKTSRKTDGGKNWGSQGLRNSQSRDGPREENKGLEV